MCDLATDNLNGETFYKKEVVVNNPDLIGKLNLNSVIKVPEVVNVSTSSEGTKKFLLKYRNNYLFR